MGGRINPVIATKRGGISAAQHAVEIVPGIVTKQRFPAAVVYLKPESGAYRMFLRFVKANSLGVVVLGPEVVTHTGTKRPKVVAVGGIPRGAASACGEPWAWEVVGDVEAITELLQKSYVGDWHGLIACSVRWSGQGNGVEKPPSSKPREKDKRDGSTAAVVTGSELDEAGHRVATWEMQSVRLVR